MGAGRGLGNGGAHGWRPASSTLATIELAAMGYGSALRIRHVPGSQSKTAGSANNRQLPRRTDPWEVVRSAPRPWRSSSVVLELRAGALRVIPGRRSWPDRNFFESPGRRLRRQDDQHASPWAAASPAYFDFQRFERGFPAGALAETLEPSRHPCPLSRRLHEHGSGPRVRAGVFRRLFARRIPRRFRRRCRLERCCRRRSPSSLNDTHPGALAAPRTDGHPAR